MHKTIIAELLKWFVELYHATWKVIGITLTSDGADAAAELVMETHALFHREINFRIETDFWA
jgi:hypothetical protein